MFRGKYLDLLKKEIKKSKIILPSHGDYQTVIDTLYQKKWVVYIKRPFATPDALIKYLSMYTNRIAISNARILALENGSVTFSYKDRRDKNKRKTLTISAVEFIRRFLIHIVPPGFVRIRQYGFLGNRVRKKMLPQKREAIKTIVEEVKDTNCKTVPIKHTGAIKEERNLCPYCKKGTLMRIKELPRPPVPMKQAA